MPEREHAAASRPYRTAAIALLAELDPIPRRRGTGAGPAPPARARHPRKSKIEISGLAVQARIRRAALGSASRARRNAKSTPGATVQPSARFEVPLVKAESEFLLARAVKIEVAREDLREAITYQKSTTSKPVSAAPRTSIDQSPASRPKRRSAAVLARIIGVS